MEVAEANGIYILLYLNYYVENVAGITREVSFTFYYI